MSSLNREGEDSVIAIIGCGFSGAMVAVHLARLAGSAPLRIVLVEKGPRFARGLAYGSPCERHLLNVPAGLMSALPDEPTHFLDWLQSRDPPHTPAPSRRGSSTGITWRTCSSRPRARAVYPSNSCRMRSSIFVMAAMRIRGSWSGPREAASIIADRVVLAMGNQPPQDPSGMASPCRCIAMWSIRGAPARCMNSGPTSRSH